MARADIQLGMLGMTLLIAPVERETENIILDEPKADAAFARDSPLIAEGAVKVDAEVTAPEIVQIRFDDEVGVQLGSYALCLGDEENEHGDGRGQRFALGRPTLITGVGLPRVVIRLKPLLRRPPGCRRSLVGTHDPVELVE